MSKLLDKNQIMFERGTEGKLLPKTVPIIGNEETSISFTPMTRAEVLEHLNVENGSTTKDADKWIVCNKLVNPSFSEEEFDLIPKGVVDSIVLTILKSSGVFPGKDSFGVGEKK